MQNNDQWDYKTIRMTREDNWVVHGFKPYPRGSVLEGQEGKFFIDSYETLEEAQAEHPDAGMGHDLLDPMISLNHLPDDGDY